MKSGQQRRNAMTTTTALPAQTEIKDQAARLLSQLAGYVGHRTIEVGLRHGLVAELAQHPEGVTPEELAAHTSLDAFYVGVWCQSAYAAEVLEQGDGRYRLAPHMATLLLDVDSPAHMGGAFAVLSQPEVFDNFSASLPTGERTWWDQTSTEWIAGVAGTGRAFYNRLIPGGLERVPGLVESLTAGARVLETACGAGVGLVKLAIRYPAGTYVGVDGDAYSLELAAERLAANGLSEEVRLLHSPLEDIDFDGEFDVVINNISMHECRDIDKVVANTYRALRPGGVFVVSDFPFPDTAEGLQTLPGRFMSGIQFFEALIDDQLLPVRAYLELLDRHGFRDVDTASITPVHAVTFGRK
jgi:SAM-dependent methyltransferase